MSRISALWACLSLSLLFCTHSVYAQTVERNVTVTAGQMQRVAFYLAAKSDCTRTPLPVVKLAEEPRNGKLIVRRGALKVADHLPCAGQDIPGLFVFFIAKPAFTGSDLASYTVELPDRKMLIKLTINVVSAPAKKPQRDMIDL